MKMVSEITSTMFNCFLSTIIPKLIDPFNKMRVLMNYGFLSWNFFTSNSVILILKYDRKQTKASASNLRKFIEETNRR